MLDISKSTTQRILKDNRQDAYHYARVQNLLLEDLPLRVQFCEWLLQQHEANPDFVKSILFTDECFSEETEHLTFIIIMYGQTKIQRQFMLMHFNIGLTSICGLRF
jgi:hypothetical protein